MNKITLENFRCFRGKHEARLAPLTLLVGENSTGKTSFLALVRALWDVVYRETAPDFKEEPYDLGSYDEIAHHRGGRGGRANCFVAGLDTQTKSGLVQDEVTFKKEGSVPVPVKRTVRRDDIGLEYRVNDHIVRLNIDASQSEWVWDIPFLEYRQAANHREQPLELSYLIFRLAHYLSNGIMGHIKSKKSPPKRLTEDDRKRLEHLALILQAPSLIPKPFASAPVRSKPRRTYDPARPTSDPDGMGIPMYLAEMHFHGGKEWDILKNALDKFGKDAGLFDEISVKRFAPTISSPFQLQVKKHGNKAKGPWRNLIDVGYGISQVLPVITELFRPDEPKMFLMQQPEVHLHPSAQAALGSLFCELAASDRQLVVETHSDYLLDRVRMEVRDGKSKLKPEDVSILFFERGDLDVRIRSLALDQEGQIIDAPVGYRKFFMEEMNRRLKI